MIWANIKECYFVNSPKDAAKIGFRDDFIYDFIKGDCTDEKVMAFEQIDHEQAIKLFEEYHEKEKEMY